MGEAKEEKKEKTPREYEWMVRPCMMYKDEYDDCTSIKARFHQYYILGRFLDCNQWDIDYHNCYQWQKHKSEQAYDELIESEKQRRARRLHLHYQNDIWEKRDEPPKNWNDPLPEWMQKEFENSYLHIRSQEMKNNKEVSSLDTRCTIL